MIDVFNMIDIRVSYVTYLFSPTSNFPVDLQNKNKRLIITALISIIANNISFVPKKVSDKFLATLLWD